MPEDSPWLEMLVNEDQLLSQIVTLCSQNGWDIVDEFHKVVYSSRLAKPTIQRFSLPLVNSYVDIPKLAHKGDYFVYLDGELMPSSYYSAEEKKDGGQRISFASGVSGEAAVYYSDLNGSEEFEFVVAKHYILRNVSGHLFGMAMLGSVKEKLHNTGSKIPFAVHRNHAGWGTQLEPQSDGIFSWAVQKVEQDNLFERHTMYFYQLEKFVNTSRMIVGWDKSADFKRLALDVEIQSSMWGLHDETQALQLMITHQFPQFYQSPYVASRTRIPQLDRYEQVATMNVKFTNWWQDSKVQLRGYVDAKTVMLVLLADTAPAWERNAVPSIPIYMGDFDVKGNTHSIMNESCVFELNGGEESRKATFFSDSPMVNTGSTMKVWLSGDVAAESNYISLRVAGQELVKLRTTEAHTPAHSRDQAEYLGEFSVYGVDGKNSFNLEVFSSSGVDGFSPVSARVWVELQIYTENAGATAALFAGTAFAKDGLSLESALSQSARFDYDDADPKRHQDTLMPMLKGYPVHPSNGIDSVMVKRTKYGARYQSYYFAWTVPSNRMPPLREDTTGAKHVRAWNNSDMSSAYQYQFNPSRYTEQVHSSRAILIHPEDGTHGTLRNVILLSPLTIMNGDELEAVDEHCTDGEGAKHQTYSYYLTEGISPLTKRAATPYRPAGIGILKAGNLRRPEKRLPISPPALVVSLTPSHISVHAGEGVELMSSYNKNSPVLISNWFASGGANPEGITVNNARFTFQKEGKYTVTFTLTNELGQTGTATADITVVK
ncbi:hypothetical protein ABH892_000199 [Paenibacillus sp. RC254]|uniref:hypothetical protein n=1 Tax=unclassified Paenibacillus TaxID=185978 RepID=UPI0024B8947A|nr:hypothetical protein [Paenibacillus sp. RC343]